MLQLKNGSVTLISITPSSFALFNTRERVDGDNPKLSAISERFFPSM